MSSILWDSQIFDGSRYNFSLIGSAGQNVGIIFSTVGDLNIPSGRAHRDAPIFIIDTVKKVNVRSSYSDLLVEFH